MTEDLQRVSEVDVVLVATAKALAQAILAVDEGGEGAWRPLDSCPPVVTAWTRSYRHVAGARLRVLVALAPLTPDSAWSTAMARLLEECRPSSMALCGLSSGRAGSTSPGDVIVAAKVIHHVDLPGKRARARERAVHATSYQLPDRFARATRYFRPSRDAAWTKLRPRSEEEQRYWLLTEVGAGRNPVESPHWDELCPEWGSVLESLWREGLLQQDLFVLTALGRRAAQELKVRYPAGLAPPALPRLVVGPLAVGEALATDDFRWNELGDLSVVGADRTESVPEFLAWAAPEPLIVQGVSDHAEIETSRRLRSFAARAAAEICLEILRSTAPESRATSEVLSDHLLPRADYLSPSALLEARRAVVPFHDRGRERELDELSRWTRSGSALSVRLFLGPSGAGKTRLFMHWCERLRSQGWAAGFWSRAQGPDQLDILLDEDRSVLMVIDGAAGYRDLCDLLRRIARGPRNPFRFRVALLEQRAGGWWDVLIRQDEPVGDVLLEYDPYRLADLEATGGERSAVCRAAAEAFAERLQRRAPAEPRRALEGPASGNLLGLHMLALADVLELPTVSEGVLGQMLGEEQRAWREKCEVPEAQAQEFSKASSRFGAAATLLGGLPSPELGETLLARMKQKKHARLVDAMAFLYPSDTAQLPGAWSGPVTPGLLGEALVGAVLSDRWTPPGTLASVFEGASEASLTHGFRVIAALLPHVERCRPSAAAKQQVMAWLRSLLSDDLEQRALPALEAALAGGDDQGDNLLGPVLIESLAAPGAPPLAARLASLIPERAAGLELLAVWALGCSLEQTLDPRERARILQGLGNRLSRLGDPQSARARWLEAVEIRRELASDGEEALRADLGESLLALAQSVSQHGQRAESEELRREAVDLWRDLASVQREAHSHGLASSLLQLGRSLAQRKEWEAAHQATREGVALLRELGERRPARFLLELAEGLTDLGVRFSELGNQAVAEKVTGEALALFRELAVCRPLSTRPGLAAALANHAHALRQSGQYDAAHLAALEAAELYRALVALDRARYLPGLAGMLNQLAIQASEDGDRDAALAAAREAVEHFRELTRAHPVAYLPELGGALNNLGTTLSALGQVETAEQITREAVDIYRELAQTHPGGYLPQLALSLNNLGLRLGELGRPDAAHQASREAAELYRELAGVKPESFRPQWAASLNSLGLRLSELGQLEDAYEAARDATAIYRELVLQTPGVHRSELASSLNGLGLRLSELGQREAAYEATREASELYRSLASERPLAYLPLLASSLNNLGNTLRELGRLEGAHQASSEATDLYRELAAAKPESFLAQLATSLHTLSASLAALGQHEAALEATAQATDLYRELARARPETYRPRLANSLVNLGRSRTGLGLREAAHAATREATELYRQLVQMRSESFRPGLAASLNTLGRTLSELGQQQAAYEATREATDLYRELAETRPDAFLPHLAAVLNNLGIRLRELGQPEAAVETTREAADLYRKLAEQRQEAFLPELAASLNNLGVGLGELGQLAEALEAVREAVEVYRTLAQNRPEAFTPCLAAGLNNLGTRLGNLGQVAEALEPTREAADLYRELAQTRPDAFLPDLAGSLQNLSGALEERGETIAALEAARESVACFVTHAERQPAAIGEIAPALARSFHRLLRQVERLKLDPSQEPGVAQALGVLRRQGGLSSLLPPRDH